MVFFIALLRQARGVAGKEIIEFPSRMSVLGEALQRIDSYV